MRRIGLALGGACLACGGMPEAGHPRILEVDFLEQRPQAPETLRFAVHFEDEDRDLGAGLFDLEVAGRRRASLPMAALFSAQSPPVPPEAEAGRLEVDVRLERALWPKERVRIGFLLADAAGRRSNRYTLTLEAPGDQ